MKKLLLAILIVILPLAGCTKSLRYTSDEISSFDKTIQEHIKNGEVTTGMTKLQVRYSWGGPDIVIVMPPDENGNERVEWVYKKPVFFKTRLIFTADKVTEIISGEFGTTK